MKFITPEIAWHNKDPIYSADFQTKQEDSRYNRLATCGTDTVIRIWNISMQDDGKATVEHLSSLTRHTKAVNVVRFSPDGKYLASGGDENVIIIWKLSENENTTPNSLFQNDDGECKEIWLSTKTLKGHVEDVYDISWSSDSRRLVSGSIDNNAILWDVKKSCRLALFPEHKSFVQGVAMDPKDQFIATLCADKACRIYGIQNKNCLQKIVKWNYKDKSRKMFHDETLKSFFRRLSFSTDGNLLVVPSGVIEQDDDNINTSFVFSRNSLNKPIMHLPVIGKATIVVKFCPKLFKLRDNINDKKVFDLEYRMIFAIASEQSVILYDTQQANAFAYISNIHYHQLSDLAWSSCAQFLVITSTDGYVTIISFSDGELGEFYENNNIITTTTTPTSQLETPQEDNDNDNKSLLDISIETENDLLTTPKSLKINAERELFQAPKSPKVDQNQCNKDTIKPRRVQVTTLSALPEQKSCQPTPRRVQLTTISSLWGISKEPNKQENNDDDNVTDNCKKEREIDIEKNNNLNDSDSRCDLKIEVSDKEDIGMETE